MNLHNPNIIFNFTGQIVEIDPSMNGKTERPSALLFCSVLLKFGNMKEIWKDINDLKGVWQISNYGNVRRVNKDPRSPRFKYYKKQINRAGYEYAHIKRNYRKTIHRLVGIHFIPNPQNYPCINHKDGNPKNNYVGNLEWCSYSYNSWHHFNVLGHKPYNTKTVINIKTGQKYQSIKQLADELNCNYKWLANKIKNRHELTDWRYETSCKKLS